jgi:hypothetical protein
VLAALGGAGGDFARGSSQYISLLAVLLDTIAAGCTVRLVTHTPTPVPSGPPARPAAPTRPARPAKRGE